MGLSDMPATYSSRKSSGSLVSRSQAVSMSVSAAQSDGPVSMSVMRVLTPSLTQNPQTPMSMSFSQARQSGISSCGRAFRAPTGLSDSEPDSEEEPSFSVQAPTGYSDSESDNEEVTSAPPRKSQLLRIRSPSPAQIALNELNRQMKLQLLVATQREAATFQAALREIDAQEALEIAEIEDKMQRRRAEEAGEEAARQAEIQEGRQRLMSGLQQEHSSQAHAMDRQAQAAAAKADALRRREEEAIQRRKEEEEQLRREQEEAARKLAEEDARKRRKAEEREAQKREAEVKSAEKAKKAAERADAERKAASQAEQSANAAKANSGARLAPEAAEFERLCTEAVNRAQEAAATFVGDAGRRKERLKIMKTVNKIMVQIGGTQEQVNARSEDGAQLLHSLSGEERAFAYIKLAQGFTDLCERVNSFFPMAEVAVAVCRAHPDFAPVLFGKLQQTCVLAVPKYFPSRRGDPADRHFEHMAYRKQERQPEEGNGAQAWESTEEFIRRTSECVRFYAAFVQSDQPSVHGVENGWSYLARLLNALPANRLTATALLSFVSIAGYKLHLVYRGQFIKLLMHVDQVFIQDLVKQGDPDAAAVYRRLQTYLHSQVYLKDPEGRKLVFSDSSAYDRA